MNIVDFILKYIQIENISNCDNISQYHCFYLLFLLFKKQFLQFFLSK